LHRLAQHESAVSRGFHQWCCLSRWLVQIASQGGGFLRFPAGFSLPLGKRFLRYGFSQIRIGFRGLGKHRFAQPRGRCSLQLGGDSRPRSLPRESMSFPPIWRVGVNSPGKGGVGEKRERTPGASPTVRDDCVALIRWCWQKKTKKNATEAGPGERCGFGKKWGQNQLLGPGRGKVLPTVAVGT